MDLPVLRGDPRCLGQILEGCVESAAVAIGLGLGVEGVEGHGIDLEDLVGEVDGFLYEPRLPLAAAQIQEQVDLKLLENGSVLTGEI